MNVVIYGVGAIGGLLGARLAEAGHRVRAVARGATLEALRTHGLRIDNGARISTVRIEADAQPAALGVQDLVIVAVKATQLDAVAGGIAPLLGPHTLVMTAMNGVPWWFFSNPATPHAGLRLPSLDPQGALAGAIPAQRTLGCVVHLAASCPQPALVKLAFGNRLILGSAVGAEAPGAQAVHAALREAGFDAVMSDDIRSDIWYKLWGNMTLNPVSVLCGATADRILDDPLVRGYCVAAMAEAAAIGQRIGCPIAQSGADRLAVARELGPFKTSMLQDAQAGRPLEIDALVTVVKEIGQAVGVATPVIDSLLGLVRVHARAHGLYPAV